MFQTTQTSLEHPSKAETSFNQQHKHSSQAKHNSMQTNIRTCKIPLHDWRQWVVLVAHTQLKRMGEPESLEAYALNFVDVCPVQTLPLWTRISVVSSSSVADPSKALSGINFSSYTQATAQCVCVRVSPGSSCALPIVPTAPQSLPALQHRHMRGSLSIRGITVEWGALHNIVRAPCAWSRFHK